jgi:glycosyltransferase involved in cell wall biosynthesis
MKKISIVIPCLNEAQNVRELYESVIKIIKLMGGYRYEMIFIDNGSTLDSLKFYDHQATIGNQSF